MATTESRPGFKLPWSTEQRPASDDPAADTAVVDEGADADPSTEHASHEPEAIVTPTATSSEPAVEARSSAPAPAAVDRPAAPHRPAKFLADLTKAMQVAAEAEREETLTQYRAEATAFMEEVRQGSGGRSAELRTQADDDVAAIREWSKAEVGRIREETERRISGRKADLEKQLERHAARVEHEVELVEGRIAGYEAEMARFFEQLLQIDDPTEFAAMAARLPEPPPFRLDPDAEPASPMAVVETPSADETVPDAHQETPSEVEQEDDPRIAALGLTPDFAAAETQAALDAVATPDDEAGVEGIATIDDEELAARVASLVPDTDESGAFAHRATIATTQVVAVGLVSVASIAGFKRHLARVPGVQSVGVTSGPDGEFVFTVLHHDDVVLREIVPTLPGFQARVSSAGEGIVNVTAHDPESLA